MSPVFPISIIRHNLFSSGRTQFVSGKYREPSNTAVTKSPPGVRGFPLATTNMVLQEAKRYIH